MDITGCRAPGCCRPPSGVLWTPGYWGWRNGSYLWNRGYWGPTVGFYGGINYGFGYGGFGYAGGYWNRGAFFYNRQVNNIGNNTNITNVYTRNVTNNITNSTVSYNGPGGATARMTAAQAAAARQPHIPPTAIQTQHREAAAKEPTLRAAVNHGTPPVAATPKPGVLSGPAVVPARHRTRSNSRHRRCEPNPAGRPDPRDDSDWRPAGPRRHPAASSHPDPGRHGGTGSCRAAATPPQHRLMSRRRVPLRRLMSRRRVPLRRLMSRRRVPLHRLMSRRRVPLRRLKRKSRSSAQALAGRKTPPGKPGGVSLVVPSAARRDQAAFCAGHLRAGRRAADDLDLARLHRLGNLAHQIDVQAGRYRCWRR